MLSALGLSGPGFDPWVGSLHCVLGEDTFTLIVPSVISCINSYQQIKCWG